MLPIWAINYLQNLLLSLHFFIKTVTLMKFCCCHKITQFQKSWKICLNHNFTLQKFYNLVIYDVSERPYWLFKSLKNPRLTFPQTDLKNSLFSLTQTGTWMRSQKKLAMRALSLENSSCSQISQIQIQRFMTTSTLMTKTNASSKGVWPTEIFTKIHMNMTPTPPIKSLKRPSW